ncbi:hypothetical protein GQ457_15G013730 [Hibiscus cannabinus]
MCFNRQEFVPPSNLKSLNLKNVEALILPLLTSSSSSSSSSATRIMFAFLKLHFNRLQVNSFHQFPSNSIESALSYFPFRSRTNPFSNIPIAKPNPFSPSGYRLFSFKPSNFSLKLYTHSAKNVFQNLGNLFTSTLSKCQETIALHFDAFFKSKYLFLFGVGGVFLCALLWRIMFDIANTFVGLFEGMEKYSILALPLQFFLSL